MGFTAVDGLPMGTRCGSLDPGVILYLMDELKMDTRAIETLIYKQSGLLGVSGVSSDMRTLLATARTRAPAWPSTCSCYRIGRELGSLVAALQGLDAIVFTAGIGEHASCDARAACAARPPGSAWSSTPPRTARAARASARAGSRVAVGCRPPTRKG